MKVNAKAWKKAVEMSAYDPIPVLMHTYDASFVCMNFFCLSTLMLQMRQKDPKKYDKTCPIILLFNENKREFYNYSPSVLNKTFGNLWADENKNNYFGLYNNSKCVPNFTGEAKNFDGNNFLIEELNSIIDFINKNKDKKDFKFDYWIDDYRLNLMWKNHSETLFNILKYCRNLNVIPNGSLQWTFLETGYLFNYKNMKQNDELNFSDQEQKWLWETIFTNSEINSDEYKNEFEKFQMSCKEWFIDNPFLIKNFSVDSEWADYCGIRENVMKFFELPLNVMSYPKMFGTDEKQYHEITKEIFGLSKNDSIFENSIVKNKDQYSSDKTNLFFFHTHDVLLKEDFLETHSRKWCNDLKRIFLLKNSIIFLSLIQGEVSTK